MSTDGRELEIPVGGGLSVPGMLTLPPGARGLVVFAHGSGSGRRSARNQAVASTLTEAGIGTLLMDLLAGDEDAEDLRTARVRFDVPRLARRVVDAIDWVDSEAIVGDLPPALKDVPLGLFGASTGAAAALIAAAARRWRVAAVVSHGGRPDLAGSALMHMTAPTLLIAGERDPEVLELNRRTQAQLPGESRLAVIAGAGHLFGEPGALDQVAALARDWFRKHLG